jgi:dipeptidyl-peptidase-4
MRSLSPIASLVALLAVVTCESACGPTQQSTLGGQCPASPASSPAPVSSVAPPIESPIDTTFLRNYAATRGFRLGTPKNGTPTPDGRSVLFLRSAARDAKQSLFETELANGTTKELLAPDAVAKGPETLSPEEKARRERLRITASGFTAFDLSDDGDKVLLSISGRLFVLTRSTGKLVELNTGKGAAVDPHFSPDGTRVMYVRDNDLRAIALDAKAKELDVTKGGTETTPHGLAEFAAQEEFGRLRGFWWSPDSGKVLYEEADQTKVEKLTIVDLAHPENTPDRPFYPRAGKTNADVRLGITAATGGGKTTWIDWDRKRLPYVTHVVWAKNGPPVIYVMDRLQRVGQLLAVDPKSGKTTLLLEEKDDAWLNLDASCPRFLPDGSFLWSSERSGQWQLGLHGTDGKLQKALTSGELGYRELIDLDVEKKIAYVAAASDPIERRLFAVPFEGAPTEINNSAPFSIARFAKNHQVYVGYEGARDGSRKWFARSLDGKINRDIPSVAENPPASNVEWVTAGSDAMRVAIVRPRAFTPGKKYRVIDAAYGGPHVVVVTADGAGFAREQWMADALDALVLKIDAKGTPFRGRAWERAIKDAFDRIPVDGHVAAIKALGEKYAEMDLERVGVFGWSFGGYFSALAVLKHGELFKVGVAGAPVVDWRDYDTAYTERYLGLPTDNAAVYDAADVTTWAKRAIAPDAPARPLLVFHGTADDNVYFFNSLKLAEALAKSGRPFELVPLPGQTHQLSSATANEIVWGRSVAFLRSKL